MQSLFPASVSIIIRDSSLIHLSLIYTFTVCQLCLTHVPQSSDTPPTLRQPGLLTVPNSTDRMKSGINDDTSKRLTHQTTGADIPGDESWTTDDVFGKQMTTRRGNKPRRGHIFPFKASTKCWSCDHHKRHDGAGNQSPEDVITIPDTRGPLKRIHMITGHRNKRSNIYGDGVVGQVPAKLLASPHVPNNRTSSVIQINCSCTHSHRLKVQQREEGKDEEEEETSVAEEERRTYLQIHTGMCNNSGWGESDSATRGGHANSSTCIIDMTVVSMHQWIMGLQMDPIEPHVRLRDGMEADAPIFHSSETEKFVIHLTTEYLRIESVGRRESVVTGELLLTPKTDWESWIAFYLLAFASGLSIICILLSFLYLSMSRRKNSRAATLTTHTSPGSNSDNCPSSLSDVEEEEQQQQQLREHQQQERVNPELRECYEMDPYPGDKAAPNPVISNFDSTTLSTNVPLSCSSTVL